LAQYDITSANRVLVATLPPGPSNIDSELSIACAGQRNGGFRTLLAARGVRVGPTTSAVLSRRRNAIEEHVRQVGAGPNAARMVLPERELRSAAARRAGLVGFVLSGSKVVRVFVATDDDLIRIREGCPSATCNDG
jgi:hypothetical protein